MSEISCHHSKGRLTIFGLFVFAAGLAGCTQSNLAPTSSSAVEALEYLDQQSGVISHEVEGNVVFVFLPKPPPADWKAILEKAALAGNEASGAEFTAAGVCADNERWRAYADSNTIGTVMARDSQIVK